MKKYQNPLVEKPLSRHLNTVTVKAAKPRSESSSCLLAEENTPKSTTEATNAMIFMDKYMEVQYSDHRRPLHITAQINDVSVMKALVDVGSLLNLIPLNALIAEVLRQRINPTHPIDLQDIQTP